MKFKNKLVIMLGSLANRLGGMALQFLSILLISRLMGAEGIGAYAVYTSWMLLLATAGGLGTSISVVRVVAVNHKQGNISEIKKFLFRWYFLLLGIGVSIAVLIHYLANLIGNWFSVDAQFLASLQLAAFGAIAYMLLRVAAETLKGLAKLNMSMGLENILISVGLILISFFWSNGQKNSLTASVVIYSHIFLMLLSFLLMSLMIWRILSRSSEKTQNCKKLPIWNDGLMPMWGSSVLGMLFLNIPLLLLPIFASNAEVGIFSVAYRFINISVSLLMVVAGIYAPKFAVAYAERDFVGLAQNLKQTRLYSLVMYAPLFAIFTLIPEFAMGLFGEEFKAGANLLTIMSVGQMIYASTGLVGTLMNMMHKEQEEFFISLCTCAMMVVFTYGLGRFYGPHGVAIGFGLGLSLKNLVSWWRVSHYLKFPKLL